MPATHQTFVDLVTEFGVIFENYPGGIVEAVKRFAELSKMLQAVPGSEAHMAAGACALAGAVLALKVTAEEEGFMSLHSCEKPVRVKCAKCKRADPHPYSSRGFCAACDWKTPHDR